MFDPLILDRFLSLCLYFVARKRLRKSKPNQNNRPFVAGFRMLRDIVSHDLHQFFSLKRLLRRAESARFEMQVVNERHGFENPINVA